MKLNKRQPSRPQVDLADDLQAFADKMTVYIADGTLAKAAIGLGDERRKACILAIEALSARLGTMTRIFHCVDGLRAQQTVTGQALTGYIVEDDMHIILRPGDHTNGLDC